MIDPEQFERLINPAYITVLFLDYLTQLSSHFALLAFSFLVVFSRFLSVFLDLIEEVNEALSISSQHILRRFQSVLTHMRMIFQPLDLALLRLKHLLHQEHFPFLVNELVPVLLVLRSLNGNSEPGGFSHVNLILHLRIDRECRWLDVCLAYFPETAFPSGSVLLPNFKGFILLTLF